MEKKIAKKLLTLPSYKAAYIEPDLDVNFEFHSTDTEKILEWIEAAKEIKFSEQQFVKVLSLFQGNGDYFQVLVP